MTATKQVIVIRRDLGMRRGKEIAQGSHASMMWLTSRLRLIGRNRLTDINRHRLTVDFSNAEADWLFDLFTKVVCQVANETELRAVFEKAKAAGLEVHLIVDAGLTEFAGVPTATALAIGPDLASKIDAVTGELKLY